MLYQAYQAQVDMMTPVRGLAAVTARWLDDLPPRVAQSRAVRGLTVGYEMLADTRVTHARPPYAIDSVRVTGADGAKANVAVHEEIAATTPFGTLLHFVKAEAPDTRDTHQPRVLVVAPLSGHFSTLLRETVRTLLADHDVYVTDWHNARDVSLVEGAFGADDYVRLIIQFLGEIGPGAHLVAVCQPCVPALAAVAVMAEGGDDATPRSMTLMAGPIDTRINPTKVNHLATSRPISWFERNVIATVPRRYGGAGRQVYPGFLQLSAFVSMNLGRHLASHWQLYADLVNGEVARATATKAFYDEYFAVLDLPAEFYLETVETVFQTQALARGVLTYQGRRVDPSAIRRTALLTVEGEHDDICAVGQTQAAHDLCSTIRPARKRHHLQPGVGHYGVFSGKRWRQQVYPVVRNVIGAND